MYITNIKFYSFIIYIYFILFSFAFAVDTFIRNSEIERTLITIVSTLTIIISNYLKFKCQCFFYIYKHFGLT